MMKTILFTIVLFASVNTIVFARQEPANESVILYDPSFWRHELKLNGNQYQRMQDINKEFYEGLVNAFQRMKNDRKAFSSVYAQCWTTRNTQLWQTMNSRQRKKWKRIALAEQMTAANHSRSF